MYDTPGDKNSETESAVEDLLRRAREGCPLAAQELFDVWAPNFLRVIRQKLDVSPRLRTLFDSTDFLQETRLTLHLIRRDAPIFESVPKFVGFLTAVARNEVGELQRKYLGTAKRDLNRECPLDSPSVCPETDLVAGEPAVSSAVLAEQQFERLLQELPALHRSILSLLRQGLSYLAIATQLDVHERTVRRIVQRIIGKARLGLEPLS